MKIRMAAVLSVALLLTACSSSGRAVGPSGSSGSTSTNGTETAGAGVGGAAGHTTATPTTATPISTAPAAPVGPTGGPVPAGFHPASVTFADPTHGWVLGTAPCSTPPCTSVLRTRDGGRTWIGIPAPKAELSFAASISNNPVHSIRFVDQLNGWAWGTELWATHDGGATWHRVTLPAADGLLTGLLTGLEASGGTVYASAGGCPSATGNAGCTGTATVLAAPVTSDAWSVVGTVPAGSPGSGGLTLNGTDWWVTSGHGLAHGTGRGAASTLGDPCLNISAAGVPTALSGFAVADPRHLDALCTGNGAAGSVGAQLMGTTDGGAHWSKSGPLTRVPTGVAGLADNAGGVLLLAGYSGGSEVLRTTDNAATWTTALNAPRSGGIPLTDLGFTTATQAVVVQWGVSLFLSTDAGAHWSAAAF